MEFLRKLTSKPTAKEVAKDRLRLILINDRANLSPDIIEMIKEDIFNVLSKYIEIDCDELDIKMTKIQDVEENSPALIANIPIKSLKIRK